MWLQALSPACLGRAGQRVVWDGDLTLGTEKANATPPIERLHRLPPTRSRSRAKRECSVSTAAGRDEELAVVHVPVADTDMTLEL